MSLIMVAVTRPHLAMMGLSAQRCFLVQRIVVERSEKYVVCATVRVHPLRTQWPWLLVSGPCAPQIVVVVVFVALFLKVISSPQSRHRGSYGGHLQITSTP